MGQGVVDFELALRGADGNYQAEISIDRGGDSTSRVGPVSLAFDLARLVELLADPDEYGRELARMLFASGAVREALAEARGAAGALQTNLRLRLALGAGAEELQALRWELLSLPGRDERLCTREDILFSRFLPAGTTALPPAPKAGLGALVAIASPEDAEIYGLAPLDMAHEKERARAGLAGMRIDWLPAGENQPCTLDRLVASAPGHEVLYLVCHGKVVRGQTWLFLQNDDGQVARVSSQDLARRLAGSLAMPRLAVLAVCESAGNGGSGAAGGAFLGSLAPRLVEVGIPAVIAMQSELSFPTSNLFLPALFRELQKDGMIDRAVAVARRSIIGRPDEFAPVLFLGLKSGLLWAAPSANTGGAQVGAPMAAPAGAPVSAAAVGGRPSRASVDSSGRPVDPVALYQVLSSDAFSMEDLEGLCFGLQVDWENLRGGVKPAKARAMVQFFQSRGRLGELVEAIRAERPDVGI